MRIRNEQFDQISTGLLETFEKSVAAHLRSRFSERLAGTSDDALARLVHSGVENARRYGIVAEHDVRRYAEYMVEYQPDFDTTPWASPILRDVKTGTEKMDDLDAHTTFELRTQ